MQNEKREEGFLAEVSERFNTEEPVLKKEADEKEKKDPLATVAVVLSAALHPLFMPFLLFVLVFYFAPVVVEPLPAESRLPMLGVLSITTLVIPLLSIVTLRYFGNIRSLQMPNRKDRFVPFFFISVFYAITTYWFLTKYDMFVGINVILAGVTFTIFFVTLVTLYWKISAHSAGISGVVGFLATFMIYFPGTHLLYPLVIMIVLTGAAMSARLYLNVHKPAEVIVGCLLGLFTSVTSVLVFF